MRLLKAEQEVMLAQKIERGEMELNKEYPLLDTILPVTFWALLDSFQGVFSAPSFRNFRTMVAGWVQCLAAGTSSPRPVVATGPVAPA